MDNLKLMGTFKNRERIEALDTFTGMWREATLLSADLTIRMVKIQFDFSGGRDPDNVLEEACRESESLPIRKSGAGLENRKKGRRGSRAKTIPRGQSMMNATHLFGYTNAELGYKPETTTLLENVSLFLLMFLTKGIYIGSCRLVFQIYFVVNFVPRPSAQWEEGP